MRTRYQPKARHSSGWLMSTACTRLRGIVWLVSEVRPDAVRSPPSGVMLRTKFHSLRNRLSTIAPIASSHGSRIDVDSRPIGWSFQIDQPTTPAIRISRNTVELVTTMDASSRAGGTVTIRRSAGEASVNAVPTGTCAASATVVRVPCARVIR